MAQVELTQSEADALLAIPKRLRGSGVVRFPRPGRGERFDLESLDGRERFHLDISRGRIKLSKRTHQTRARHTVILARLDLEGPPHRNPDGTEVGGNHLHIYRQGYADKWAYEPPSGSFSDLTDLWLTLMDFLDYCAIQTPVDGQQELALL